MLTVTDVFIALTAQLSSVSVLCIIFMNVENYFPRPGESKLFREVGMQINSMLAFGAIKLLFLQIEDFCQHSIASC